uniref:Uncharacterized protein n=1 Tax=Lotharella oceanica TaxID=641309 RepID=A0A7S2XF89_9EUKA|mmetsp:Transcript_35952/g.66486  ORF Transcript_35952/g.66486 Transcript_35952/m.66486 type:complete len:253 (+) Transcript_35952:160-918(+)
MLCGSDATIRDVEIKKLRAEIGLIRAQTENYQLENAKLKIQLEALKPHKKTGWNSLSLKEKSLTHRMIRSCNRGDARAVEYWTTKLGVAVNCKDDSNWTPVVRGCIIGSLDVVKILVEHKATLDGYDLETNGGRPAISWAARDRSLDVLKFFIEEIKLDVDTTDTFGSTPLIHASMNNEVEVVKYLLDARANPRVRGDEGKTAREWATDRKRNKPVHDYLLMFEFTQVLLRDFPEALAVLHGRIIEAAGGSS